MHSWCHAWSCCHHGDLHRGCRCFPRLWLCSPLAFLAVVLSNWCTLVEAEPILASHIRGFAAGEGEEERIGRGCRRGSGVLLSAEFFQVVISEVTILQIVTCFPFLRDCSRYFREVGFPVVTAVLHKVINFGLDRVSS